MSTEIAVTDADWLRAARDQLGLSQTQLAQALHVSQSLVAMMEAGDRQVTRRTRAQVEDLLSRSPTPEGGER